MVKKIYMRFFGQNLWKKKYFLSKIQFKLFIKKNYTFLIFYNFFITFHKKIKLLILKKLGNILVFFL